MRYGLERFMRETNVNFEVYVCLAKKVQIYKDCVKADVLMKVDKKKIEFSIYGFEEDISQQMNLVCRNNNLIYVECRLKPKSIRKSKKNTVVREVTFIELLKEEKSSLVDDITSDLKLLEKSNPNNFLGDKS